MRLDGEDIFRKGIDLAELRKRVGMVFQKPNPFPMSIYDNIAYGPRVHGIRKKKVLDEIVEKALRGAALWDEVHDRLRKSAMGLSGGQQQRLCIARVLAVEPEVVLMPADIVCNLDLAAAIAQHNASGCGITAVCRDDAVTGEHHRYLTDERGRVT